MALGKKREWIRKRLTLMAAGAAAGSGSPRWKLRLRAFSSALRWRPHRPGGLPHVDVLAVLYENVVFYLLWVLESVIVVSKLCFFFVRFGFRL